MATITIELPSDAYRQLRQAAQRLGRSPQAVAQEWLLERLGASPVTAGGERELALQALSAAGLLTGLGPGLQERADTWVRLEDVQGALGRAGGKPLSEIVLEQRGPKV